VSDSSINNRLPHEVKGAKGAEGGGVKMVSRSSKWKNVGLPEKRRVCKRLRLRSAALVYVDRNNFGPQQTADPLRSPQKVCASMASLVSVQCVM